MTTLGPPDLVAQSKRASATPGGGPVRAPARGGYVSISRATACRTSAIVFAER